MPAGNHSVTVTDANNCSETMSIELVEPDVLIVNGSSSGDYNPFPGGFDISSKGLNDGECYRSVWWCSRNFRDICIHGLDQLMDKFQI